jgi:hypothetical protein
LPDDGLQGSNPNFIVVGNPLSDSDRSLGVGPGPQARDAEIGGLLLDWFVWWNGVTRSTKKAGGVNTLTELEPPPTHLEPD